MATVAIEKARPLRMSAKDRRQQIVAVSAELFSQKGFNGTTTKEIANRAGVSEAIIFRHFTNKEELYSAILDYKVRQSAERTTQHLKEAASRKDDHAFFSTLAYEVLEFHRKDPTLMRLLMFSALEGHELSDIFFQSTTRGIRDYIRRYINQRISDGAFRKIDPVVGARAFIGMVTHQAQLRGLFKRDDLKHSNRRIADQFADIFLKGICKH
jgi:AcrR family transcriptional regulator